MTSFTSALSSKDGSGWTGPGRELLSGSSRRGGCRGGDVDGCRGENSQVAGSSGDKATSRLAVGATWSDREAGRWPCAVRWVQRAILGGGGTRVKAQAVQGSRQVGR